MNPILLGPDHVFSSHSWNAFKLCFSPDGTILATATVQNHGVQLVDTVNWQVKRMLPEADFPPGSMEFSPDGETLLVALGGAHPTCCWEVNSGRLKWSIPKGKNLHAVFSSDGKLVATTNAKTMLLVDATNGAVLQKLDGHTVAIGQTEFSPDGSRVASLGGTQVWLWDVQVGKAVRLVQEKQKKVTQIKFSPTGKLLGVTSQDGGVRLYDSKTGELVRDFEGHDGMAWDFAFIDSETKVVSLGWDQRIRYWDVDSGQETQVIRLPDEVSVANLTLFSGERAFAVTLWRPVFEAHVFETQNGRLLARLSTHPLEDSSRFTQFRPNPEVLAVSPKGDWLAGACNDGKTRVWSLKGIKTT